MDRIFSARLDVSVLSQIRALAKKLKTTNKSVLEKAVTAYALKMGGDGDVFGETCGAWNHGGNAEKEIAEIRGAFRKSMRRRVL